MVLEEQAAALLEDIRNALSITWADEDTDKQLKGIIARGIARLNGIAGTEVDYTAEDTGKALLINYCFYARNNALDPEPDHIIRHDWAANTSRAS
mgnify:CR=1 FL=1